MQIDKILNQKINLFMNTHVLTRFNPSEIFWWFSLSGGKDSFSMSRSVHDWYVQNNQQFNGIGFTIKQWDNRVFENIKKQINWMDIINIDAINRTKNETSYKVGQQAPCKVCSHIRRNVFDEYLSVNKVRGMTNFLARGLHLGDTAISCLWRWVFSDSPTTYIEESKGIPLSKIDDIVYLCKPLCYAREIETQLYADYHNYRAECCGCPACKFPSRRDIVEESLLYILKDNNIKFWELSVPGITQYLDSVLKVDIDIIKTLSLPGFANKNNHIPDDFYDYMFSLFSRNAFNIDFDNFNKECVLDDLGSKSIINGEKFILNGKLPIPKFLYDPLSLSSSEKRSVSTLGPLWGAIGLNSEYRLEAFSLQQNYFNYSIDENWSQVNFALAKYYKGRTSNEKTSGCNLCDFCIKRDI